MQLPTTFVIQTPYLMSNWKVTYLNVLTEANSDYLNQMHA